MYKPWVKTIDLATAKLEVDTVSDLDHPNFPKLAPHSTKQARTSIAMIKITQSENECLRQLFAAYLKDTAANGTYLCCIGLSMLILHDS